jgi:hypothetical protein
MIERRILVSSERFQVDSRSITRHGDELLPRDEPTAAERNQLPDTMTVPGDGKGLPVLNGIHDLSRFRPQVALRDLWASAHHIRIAPCAIRCYRPLEGPPANCQSPAVTQQPCRIGAADSWLNGAVCCTQIVR